MDKIAVALSIYKLDSLENIKLAIDSILNQTYINFDIYIQVDGEINSEVETYLKNLSEKKNIFIELDHNNKGLAYRLNQIINKVVEKQQYQFLARMDADDISAPERFKKQIQYLYNNPEIDIVGSDVIEINENGEDIFYKKMENSHDALLKNIIKRCPFNHPTVMMKVAIFEDGFRYNSNLMNTQDYYLWVNMLSAGKQFSNINEPLLKFRINDNFHKRRGLKKAINDIKSRHYAIKKLNNGSIGNYTHIGKLFLLRIAPSSLKKIAYQKLR